ncbi:hypothetical protein GSI_11137 [Ganoderma sinense ZZ0214-1]|uniref:Uncharacterized protein n=1 Tax=Ganoderma sinense ZZ0214-1 TaxID=1077348 RepID=A0A2G8RZ56_9APHY|nr:hypothetical protein GSI_11137 [Ganoderma sinense ZZ0214-1]
MPTGAHCAYFQDEMPSALGAAIRLHFTKIPRSIYLRKLHDDSEEVYYALLSREEIVDTYSVGAETRKKLPLRCADAIRTLKYIAVSDEDPCWDDEHDNEYELDLDGAVCNLDWGSAGERYGGGADEYEYQPEWHAKKTKTLQWWRVEQSFEEGRRKTELQPLTPEKGRAVQRFLEEADFESMERIDELLS